MIARRDSAWPEDLAPAVASDLSVCYAPNDQAWYRRCALIVFTVSLDTFGVTFFTIGTQGHDANESGHKVGRWALTPTVNALGT